MKTNLLISALLISYSWVHVSAQSNAQLETTVRGLLNAADAGDAQKVSMFYAADAKLYFNGHESSIQSTAERTQIFKTAFPDCKRIIESWYVSNNTGTVRGSFIGTNSGMFMGKPATGRRVQIPWIGIYTCNAQGKLTYADVIIDAKALDMQLYGDSEKWKTDVRNAYEFLNKRDYVNFKTLCAENFIDYSAGPEPIVGIDHCISAYNNFFSMMPDLHFDITNVIIDGNRAIIESTTTGTNTGPVMQMFPPSGKKIKTQDIDIVEFNMDGKAISHRTMNPNEVFHQMGYGALTNPNTQVILQCYKAFGEGNIPGILANLSTNVVWDVTNNPLINNKTIYQGSSNIVQFFNDINTSAQITKFEPNQFTADGDVVMTAIQVEWTSKKNGKSWSSVFYHHFKLIDHEITWFREIGTTPQEMKSMIRSVADKKIN